MHRYRIVARISLILFMLNLVLAAPAVVQEIHEARADDMVVAEPSSSSSPHDAVADPSHDGVAEASHDGVSEASHDGVEETSHDGVAEASYYDAAEASHEAMASPQHSSSGNPTPQLSFDSSLSGHSWLLNRPLLSPDRPSSHDSGSEHDLGSEHDSGSELSLDELPPPSPSPPTETAPDDAGFFNQNRLLKLKMLASAIIIGGTITGLVVASNSNHTLRDFEDSST
jgi:hypothetical protein